MWPNFARLGDAHSSVARRQIAIWAPYPGIVGQRNASRRRHTFAQFMTISEKSSVLNLLALDIREAHERPESMDRRW